MNIATLTLLSIHSLNDKVKSRCFCITEGKYCNNLLSDYDEMDKFP